MTALIRLTPPAAEPVTQAEAKAHLRVDTTADDTLIASLIAVSRERVESAAGRALITQTWRLSADTWPEEPVMALGLAPILTLDAIRVFGADGVAVAESLTGYQLDSTAVPARLVRLKAAWPLVGRPAAGIEIDMTAGYGASASAVPADLKQAILILVAHLYENRGDENEAWPEAAQALIAPYRLVRL